MLRSVEIVEKTNPDIIRTINFGCPVKKVVSKGAGARNLKRYEIFMVRLAKAMVKST